MADWIIVVDDDTSNLKVAGHILSRAGMRVTALKSGKIALEYIRKNGFPDLILLDVNMPDMDGFETLKQLKNEMIQGNEVPVVFLTAEDGQEQETKGLESGAMDYIKKPFDPEVLVSRVHKILDIRKQIQVFAKNAETDQLTGFMNKAATEARMERLCAEGIGLLCVLDLDTFKMVNDIFGHDVGDQVLVMFSETLKKNLRKDDECGRIGGDEFVVFLRNMSSNDELTHFARRINEEYQAGIRSILGEKLTFSAGVSVGAVAVPEYGHEYPELFHMVDQALYIVKKNGKHGGRLYSALDQGKDVFVYPGDPDSEYFEGNHRLLREGGIYFTEAEDVLSDLHWLDNQSSVRQNIDCSAEESVSTPEQAAVIRALKPGNLSFEQLLERTCLDPPVLMSTLTMLQISGLIEALPGKQYKIKH